jgi:capsular polysaccharide biosynthesis protein
MTEHFKLRSKVYAKVVSRWLLVTALVFCAVMAGGIYITDHLLAKVYSATATLQVQTHGASAEAYSGWAFSSPQSRAVQAELESIESPEILRGVITDLALDKAWGERIFDRSDPLTADDSLHYLKSHLRLKFKHDSKVVEVTALSDDPKEAAQIANEVVDQYKVSRATLAREEALSPGDTPALSPGTVKITSRAQVPSEPSAPNRRFCYAISAGIAGMLAVMIASAMEVCLLIARAEAASGELAPPR